MRKVFHWICLKSFAAEMHVNKVSHLYPRLRWVFINVREGYNEYMLRAEMGAHSGLKLLPPMKEGWSYLRAHGVEMWMRVEEQVERC